MTVLPFFDSIVCMVGEFLETISLKMYGDTELLWGKYAAILFSHNIPFDIFSIS